MPTLLLKGFVRDIHYVATLYPELRNYQLDTFDVNAAAPYGIVQIDDATNNIGYSTWVSPKRTRSYPFARIYNIFNLNTKRIAIIPIIKDEGGDSQNNDRVNFITLSWMNLLNVYIILGWYETADKIPEKGNLITNQKVTTQGEYSQVGRNGL